MGALSPAPAGGRSSMFRRMLWPTLYAIAMAYVESAVVVYLREIYYPEGFAFPIVIIPDRMTLIEIGREAATILMLVAAAVLSGAGRMERFLHFCYLFGVWDLFYYLWLRVFIGWPPSLLTWDILFLIPVPWIGPVLAPVLISIAMILASIWLISLEARGVPVRFSGWLWALAAAGGVIVVLAFALDFRTVLDGAQPGPFRWGLFLAGFGMALAALLAGAGRFRRTAGA